MGTDDALPRLEVIAEARGVLDARHKGVDADGAQAEHPLLHDWLDAYEKVWRASTDVRARVQTGSHAPPLRLPGLPARNRPAQIEDPIQYVTCWWDGAIVSVVLPSNQQASSTENLIGALNHLVEISRQIVRPPDVSDRPTERYPSIDRLEASALQQASPYVPPMGDSVLTPSTVPPSQARETDTELRTKLAERLIVLLDTMVGLWNVTGKPAEVLDRASGPLGQVGEQSVTTDVRRQPTFAARRGRYATEPSSAFDIAVRQHLKLDILELLSVCCGLDPIEVHVGQPLDETRMVAVRGEPSVDRSQWGCVAEELKWGYVDQTGAVYRRAEVVIYSRQS